MSLLLCCSISHVFFTNKVTPLTGRGKSSLFKVQKKDAERDGIRLVVTTLKHQKREPEDQKDQLKGELEQVKAEWEESKKKLTEEITEKYQKFDKPETKICETQLLNIKTLLERLEIQMAQMKRKDDSQKQKQSEYINIKENKIWNC